MGTEKAKTWCSSSQYSLFSLGPTPAHVSLLLSWGVMTFRTGLGESLCLTSLVCETAAQMLASQVQLCCLPPCACMGQSKEGAFLQLALIPVMLIWQDSGIYKFAATMAFLQQRRG